MKAVSIKNVCEISVVDMPKPELGSDEVLIKLRYVGLCGSDLKTYKGQMPMVEYPRIPGHEVSGEIVDKGANVPDSLALGAKVTVSPYTNCGFCPACRIGKINCCQFNQTLGVQRDGALTEYLAIHYQKVYSSETLSFEELVLAEPLSVGYHAANRGEITEIDSVVVIGCGLIGMGAITAAARKGATVIAVDIDDRKLEQAKQFGANFAVNSKTEDVKERISQITNGEGVNVAIEAVGLPETFVMAVDLAAFAGRVVYVGYAKNPVSYDTKQFVAKELNIYGSRNALLVFPAVLKLLEERKRPFTSLITKTYSLEDAPQAFADWAADIGAFTKILISLD